MFIFHKNSNVHSKAKVKPPRMNGKKTGVFSTRSPYRPNNIGLTLAKIEGVKGSTVTVSGIDILDGTPIIDLKPFIPMYDNPVLLSHEIDETVSEQGRVNDCMTSQQSETKIKDETENRKDFDNMEPEDKPAETELSHDELNCHVGDSENLIRASEELENLHKFENNCLNIDKEQELCPTAVDESDGNKVIKNRNTNVASKLEEPRQEKQNSGTERSDIKCCTADWITNSPVTSLEVRFTPSAEEQLKLFSCEDVDTDFKFQCLKSFSQAKQSIIDILHQDPRSTYRRKQCSDSLYYFTLDVLHITCWFDVNLVEIVRIKPVGQVDKLKS
ncbi:tRNA (adenine(37)-N6)-methyltransferase-like isoform X2 [Ruditapes philippinarum]|nr:tRNA (adenine(37)-N6)-methyltransferase-like isoform X2 [Ruditapes philippinarum]